MGILDDLLAGLDPETRNELAKKAAGSAVKSAADRVYDKVDAIREDFEDAAEARRESIAKEKAAKQREADAEQAEQDLDDELAALKRKIEREG